MGDEAALRSALTRLADVNDETAAAELVQAVAHAAGNLPSGARSAACSLMFGSGAAAALAALERVAPSQSAEMYERRSPQPQRSRVEQLTRGPRRGVRAGWGCCWRTPSLHRLRALTPPLYGTFCAVLLGCTPSDGERVLRLCAWPARCRAQRQVRQRQQRSQKQCCCA